MRLNWMTKCVLLQFLNMGYFLSASHTSVHSNLEHGLAILQRALVHSNLNYTTSLAEVQSISHVVKPIYPWYYLFAICSEMPVLTGFYLFKLATATGVAFTEVRDILWWKFPLLLPMFFINNAHTDASIRASYLHFTALPFTTNVLDLQQYGWTTTSYHCNVVTVTS